ncbi:MAG: arylesterase [Pseudomonadota bacterium]
MGSDILSSVARMLGNWLGHTRYGARRVLNKAMVVVALSASALSAEELTLVAFGDSLTQGYGLPVEDGFVPQLQAWLTERGHEVDVVNAGVSGDTTAGGLARIGWTIGGAEVDAIIVALGGNDLLRGIDPAVSRANLEGILQQVRDLGLPVVLAGLNAPGNYGPDYARDFNAIYPELAEEYGALHVPSFLGGLEDALAAGTPPLRLVQPDGIHPSTEGVTAIVEALGPVVEELLEQAEAQVSN